MGMSVSDSINPSQADNLAFVHLHRNHARREYHTARAFTNPMLADLVLMKGGSGVDQTSRQCGYRYATARCRTSSSSRTNWTTSASGNRPSTPLPLKRV